MGNVTSCLTSQVRAYEPRDDFGLISVSSHHIASLNTLPRLETKGGLNEIINTLSDHSLHMQCLEAGLLDTVNQKPGYQVIFDFQTMATSYT